MSLTGLAKYVASSPAPQRKILQDHKFPASDEAFAMRVYYREATDILKDFIDRQGSNEWLRQQALALRAPRPEQTPKGAARLERNAAAVMCLDRYFGGRKLERLDCPRFRLAYSNVLISVVPHLYVRDGSKMRLIKLQFGGKALPDQAARVIVQCMLEGTRSQGLDLPPSSVMYVDLPRSVVHTARAGKKTLNDIKAACETISQIWDSIPPPAASKRKKVA
ncbi:MAG TPA: hypothetical protein PLH72_04900 [Vicinamibacterales bacterium]|nr:hypothetical protein [Vicinamibacterales bacterium]